MGIVSCSPSYYYTQISSPNDYLSRKPSGDFVFENDSLWIAYMFGGENAPISISIGNKLDVPLFVDWNQSFLLIGEKRYPYVETKKTSNLQKTEIAENFKEPSVTEYPSTSAGKNINKILPQGIEVIPSGYSFNATLAWINPDVEAYQQNKRYQKHKIANKKGEMMRAKKLNFDEVDSPLRFSSIISYNFEDTTPMENFFSDFYVKNVIKTSLSPKDLNSLLIDKGDIFYTYIPPNYAAGEIIGATVLTMGFVVLDATLSKNSY